MKCSASALVVLAACGAKPAAPTSHVTPTEQTPAERMLGLVPEGAQIIVELDLARLRANPAVGALATRALANLSADAQLPGLPLAVQGSPLGGADAVLIAAFGVGTPQAAVITLLDTRADVAGGTKLAPTLVAFGPDDWIGQLQARATIAGLTPDGAAPVHATKLAASQEVLLLRDHAMPPKAPGAIVRVTARLPFDARVALARQTGVDTAPAQLSLWADVADDFAMIVDCDAVDPGDKREKESARRLEATVRRTLELLANSAWARSLGIGTSLVDAKLVAQGSWVRTIIAVGPRHLERVVQRAGALLEPAP